MEWIAGRLTDVFLTVSDAEAADARRLGIARNAVSVGNGRDPAAFHPDPATRARIRAALGVAADQVVIIAVSRLVRHKGYPELLAAMEQVAGAELWVVGERLATDRGDDMGALFAACPRMRRLGYRTDIPALLAAADIFVLPSHFEGLPMSVIEAMLTGLPVVSTTIRGPAGAGGAWGDGPAGAPRHRGAAGWCAEPAGGQRRPACGDGRGGTQAGDGAIRRGGRGQPDVGFARLVRRTTTRVFSSSGNAA